MSAKILDLTARLQATAPELARYEPPHERIARHFNAAVDAVFEASEAGAEMPVGSLAMLVYPDDVVELSYVNMTPAGLHALGLHLCEKAKQKAGEDNPLY